jgi:hypothetical protein
MPKLHLTCFLFFFKNKLLCQEVSFCLAAPVEEYIQVFFIYSFFTLKKHHALYNPGL